MNTKNKTLAILFDNTILSVARSVNPLQLALFGLGYKWPYDGDRPTVFEFPKQLNALYLNIETKQLSWDQLFLGQTITKKHAYTEIRLTANNLVDVLDFVEHPLKPNCDVTIEEVHDDRSIKFIVDTDEKTVTVNLVKKTAIDRDIVHNFEIYPETLDKVQEALGHDTVFPVVRFSYPSSSNGVLLERIVRVTFANDVYVRGYELETESSDKGTFKAFQKKKIKGKVDLISFNRGEN